MLQDTVSHFSQENYKLNKYLIIIISLVIVLAVQILPQTNISAGNVNGTWAKANSPFLINGEITIPNGETLVIEPGVDVVFKGHFKFNVQGRLVAIGTQQDSIHFIAENSVFGWHGIRFNYTSNANDTSKIIYCSLKYGIANTGAYNGSDRCGGAVFIQSFDKVLISNSLFEANMNNGDIASATGGAAIYVAYAKPIITKSTFLNNVGTTDCAILLWYTNAIVSNNVFKQNSGPHGPIFCGYNSPTISNNIIANNTTTRAGGGIFNMTSTARIENNIIVNNKSFGGEGEGGGIKCWINDKSKIINNTIAFNSAEHGGGICCNSNSDPIFINNIIWGNTSTDGSQVNLLDTQSDPYFLYCDIQGRKAAFGGNGAGANYTGVYESNIDLNPLFKDTSSADYSLLSPSHCIGAGCDSAEVNGIWYNAPKFCILGNPRPSPISSSPDIGACENLSGSVNINVTVFQPKIDKMYAIVNVDSVLFRTRFSNPFNLKFVSHIICVNSDSTKIDSLILFDDGMHGDSLENDGLYATYIPPRTSEDFYNINVSTIADQNLNYFILKDECRFTTIGPVRFDSVSYRKGLLNYHYLRPFVRNWSTVKTIKNASLRIISDDLWIASIGSGGAGMPDISPNSSVGISSWITISVIDSLFPSYFNFRVEIMSDGWVYWLDSTQMIITGLESETQQLLSFKLEQNYPNPFNPSTKISWHSPVSSWQMLKVYDVLGNNVATLVDEYRSAGNYETEFNASDFSSGIYFYQLKAGNFVETKKMILLR